MRGLKGKVAIVTGAANGIGRAIAMRLAEEGCTVGIFDLDETGALDCAGQIQAQGGHSHVEIVDIGDHAAVERAVAAIEDSRGPVDILVNNAGWDRAANFVDTDPEFWDKVIRINLYGPLNMHSAVLKRMAARGRGCVVNIASDAGRVGSSGEAVYSACKGGVIALTKTLGARAGREGDTAQRGMPRPDRYRDLAELYRWPRRGEDPRGPQARDPDEATGHAGRLSRDRRVPRERRRRVHHRADDQRFGWPDDAGLTRCAIEFRGPEPLGVREAGHLAGSMTPRSPAPRNGFWRASRLDAPSLARARLRSQIESLADPS